MKRIYFGRCTPSGVQVRVQEIGGKCTALPNYRHLVDHGADRFAWGTGDRAAQQLAFALCYHEVRDKERAADLAPEITRRIVALLPPKEWAVSDETLLAQILLVESLLVGCPE